MEFSKIISGLEALAASDRHRIVEYVQSQGHNLYTELQTHVVENLPENLYGLIATLKWSCSDNSYRYEDVFTWEYSVDEYCDVYITRTWAQIADDILRDISTIHSSEPIMSARILASEDDDWSDVSESADSANDDKLDHFESSTPDNAMDQLDTLSDSLDDIQDAIKDIDEDELGIELDNNIADKYIAECDTCKGVFISAVATTDIAVNHIVGECPLCGKETTQYLKWRIVAVGDQV